MVKLAPLTSISTEEKKKNEIATYFNNKNWNPLLFKVFVPFVKEFGESCDKVNLVRYDK